mmetsp:Transcript_19155/g.60238  ORF Transcript_19155/g.60238 Transcript_19155/m.60238 type:complete len:232 (-) Transcript_19155:305-1000(-)
MAKFMVETADMAWEIKCRQEDMRQRAVDNERRSIDDARRNVDEKAEQLKAVSHLSALIAGFAMIVMVEVELPDSISLVLLIVYSATCASVVGLMLLAMLNCTIMLIAVMKYDCVNRPIPFRQFWQTRCEADWRFAYRCFSLGVPMFMIVLAQIGWVVFDKYQSKKLLNRVNYRDLSASVVTCVAILCLMLWSLHTKAKWDGFVHDSTLKLVDPDNSINPHDAKGPASLSHR